MKTLVKCQGPHPGPTANVEINFQGIDFEITLSLNSDSHQKNLRYLLHWKPFKNDKKYFLFHLKSSFVLKIFKFLS